jgi:hypothetical protein
MVKSPIFWLMYLMFVLMGAGGLMAAARSRADRQISKSPTSR